MINGPFTHSKILHKTIDATISCQTLCPETRMGSPALRSGGRPALGRKSHLGFGRNCGMLTAQMSVKVKICGITNLDDGLAAAEAGADALGFVFCEQSPRCVAIETAGGIVRRLPPFVVKVGVFVNAPADLVYRAISGCDLNLLQFHGDQ